MTPRWVGRRCPLPEVAGGRENGPVRSSLPALAVAAAILLLPTAPPAAGPGAAEPPPGPRERCPVCGMFVAKYPDWLAGIRFADGARALFDGCKDLFRFWLDPGAFLPSRRREQVTSIFVTDYYTLEPIDARGAFFVQGSDVLGPMGRELVPFSTREAAEEFLRDHRGSAVLGFDAVTPEIVRALDR